VRKWPEGARKRTRESTLERTSAHRREGGKSEREEKAGDLDRKREGTRPAEYKRAHVCIYDYMRVC